MNLQTLLGPFHYGCMVCNKRVLALIDDVWNFEIVLLALATMACSAGLISAMKTEARQDHVHTYDAM
jgi:hypothetical protein